MLICKLLHSSLSWPRISVKQIILILFSSPPHKRQKSNASNTSAAAAIPAESSSRTPPQSSISLAPPPQTSALNPRKRRASGSPRFNTLPPGTTLPPPTPVLPGPTESSTDVSIPALLSEDSSKKRGRTNTPWTATEEQRLKQMRDVGNSWSEIAKVTCANLEAMRSSLHLSGIPNQNRRQREETLVQGNVDSAPPRPLLMSIQDMHYAEFAEDEVNS